MGGRASVGPFEPWPAAAVHAEWGSEAAGIAAAQGDVVVVVDVLSFSTTVTLAVGAGAVVLCYSPEEIGAMGGRVAAERRLDAQLMAKDRSAPPGRFSLSPASLGSLVAGDRVVFTSWNGARCLAAAEPSPLVLVGGNRNRAAVVRTVARLVGGGGQRCTLVACGERWRSVTSVVADGLRPGVEDWLAVGAIAAGFADYGLSLSPEAQVAAGAYAAVSDRLASVLRTCVSGRELVAQACGEDVELAAGVDVDAVCPGWRPGETARRELADVAAGPR